MQLLVFSSLTHVQTERETSDLNMDFRLFDNKVLSCQPRVKVTSCFVYKVIRYLEPIDHLCITLIHMIGLIHK